MASRPIGAGLSYRTLILAPTYPTLACLRRTSWSLKLCWCNGRAGARAGQGAAAAAGDMGSRAASGASETYDATKDAAGRAYDASKDAAGTAQVACCF